MHLVPPKRKELPKTGINAGPSYKVAAYRRRVARTKRNVILGKGGQWAGGFSHEEMIEKYGVHVPKPRKNDSTEEKREKAQKVTDVDK